MKIQVFVSESRVTKKKYVEEYKPKERLAHLEKYPKSSFKKFTDNKGKIVPEGQQKPKKKLSGKPKLPASKRNTAPTKVKRNPITKKFAKEIKASVGSARAQRGVASHLEKINNGTATKRNLTAIKRHVPEDMHDKLDQAFDKAKQNAKTNVEERRKEISKPKARRKSVRPKANTAAEPKAATVEKPTTKDAAAAIQKIPKKQRASVMESVKRVFSRKATDQDVQKLEKAKKGMDKTSRESLDKLKRYAEAGIIGKQEKAAAPKKKSRKKLTKRNLYDRVRDVDMPKVAKYRERQGILKEEFREKATAIAKGKGTKAVRKKRYEKLRESYVAKLERNANLANKLTAKIRDNLKRIKAEDDREDGF